MYTGYKEDGCNSVEIVNASDESINISAIYCEYKGYDFITYCFLFDRKGEIMVGIVPEMQEYFYIKQSWIQKILKKDPVKDEGIEIFREFKNKIKNIGEQR